MIKAVIFDVGGVLYKESIEDVYSKLCKILDLSINKFNKSRDKYLESAQTGKIAALRYPALIAKDLKIKNIKKFIEIWKKLREREMKLDKDVEKTILKLKKKYIIGTLTNIISLHHKIRLKKNVYKYFKVKLVSCEIGYRKPDIRIYKLLIKKLNLESKEIIFIDDRSEHLKPAKKLGINAILFKNNNQLVKDLRKLGVKI